MPKTIAKKKKLLKELNSKLKELQDKQKVAKKAAGIDDYVDIKVGDRHAHFKRIKIKDKSDKGIGIFSIEIIMTTNDHEVLVPLSIASGKKVAGFIYYIEGDSEGSIVTAGVKGRGEGVTQIKLGTLIFAKIPPKRAASFRIQIEIYGRMNKTYTVVINRINYKLKLTDTRYNQYIKPITSNIIKFK